MFKAKRRDRNSIEMYEWEEERPASKIELYHNPDRKTIPARWSKEPIGYYGKWTDLAIAAINKKMVPVGDDLKKQIQSLPKAVEDTARELKKTLAIDNSKALKLLLKNHLKDVSDDKVRSGVNDVIQKMIEEIEMDMSK